MSDLLKYQCLACGGALKFDATQQMLACESCDSVYPSDYIDQTSEESTTRVDWNTEGFVDEKQTLEKQNGFTCTSCGAQVICDTDTVASECMYCGNPVVMDEKSETMVEPDFVIPFKIDHKKAKEMLEDFYKGKPLLPNAFSDENHLSKIKGVYVPFWLFSCMGSGYMVFDTTKVKTYSDEKYNYKKTEHYEVLRSGQIGFDRIPTDASKKMDDHYMEGIEPYNFEELSKFKPMYLAGYFADKFDISVDQGAKRATERVIASLESAFEETVEGYTSVIKKTSLIQMNKESIEYVLLPVWMLNTKYNGEIYQFAINGQTGQVAGKLPIDKAKLMKYRLIYFFVSAAICACLLMWMFR